MNLEVQKYKETNRLIAKILSVTLAWLLLSSLSGTLFNSFEIKNVLRTIVTGCALIFIIIGYIKRKDSPNYIHFAILAYLIAYAVMLLTNNFYYTYMYVFPVLFVTVLYTNRRSLLFIDILILGINLIDILRCILGNVAGFDYYANVIVRGFILGICMYMSTNVTCLLNLFSQKELNLIKEQAQQQHDISSKNIQLATEIITQFQLSDTRMQELIKNIDVSYTSVQEIASSYESMVGAIQKQNEMTYDIEENVKNTDQEIQGILSNAENSKEMISNGLKLIEALKSKTSNVKETSDVVRYSVDTLLQQISSVENITETILSISSQTNLLALNASIEAARAGEAGKGFSVVATEIRKLSDEIKLATIQIAEIIQGLIGEAKNVYDNTLQSTQSVTEQTNLMNTTEEKFLGIGLEMENLYTSISEVNKNIHSIVKATEKISHNITHLSATTEEVAAASNNGVSCGEDSIHAVKIVKDSLLEINRIANCLSQNMPT